MRGFRFYFRKINFHIQEKLRRKKWIEKQKKIGTKINFLSDPELKKKLLIAGKSIGQKGKNKVFNRIFNDIYEGKITWIPDSKRAVSVCYIELKLGKVEVGDRLIKKMDLEKEVEGLNTLMKLY